MTGALFLLAFAAYAAPHSRRESAALMPSDFSFGATHRTIRAPSAGRYRIAMIADMHLGDPGLHGNEYTTNKSLAEVRMVLDAHAKDIDLVVLAGDQLQAADLNTTQWQVWTKLTDELNSRGLPHTALIGNHDADPFVSSNFTVYDIQSLPDAFYWAPGAVVSRQELERRDCACHPRKRPRECVLLPAAAAHEPRCLPVR